MTAYYNEIVPQVAAEVIMAYMEYKRVKIELERL